MLYAQCGHPAVEVALRSHAERLDEFFRDLSRADLGAASLAFRLPHNASADGVTPRRDENGKLTYRSTNLRFHSAEDRVQELLMGPALYSDPALTVRELYQNALDACRYRAARTQYLQAAKGKATPWKPEISIRVVQDTDDRRVLECEDNGIGMGLQELGLFCEIGSRFVTLPDYVDESRRWKVHGVEMHPNSRFGIGVLSYFMVADELSIRTTRLSDQGYPGKQLNVRISGPGAMFRVSDEDDLVSDAGTLVRLFLREGYEHIECVDILRRLSLARDRRASPARPPVASGLRVRP